MRMGTGSIVMSRSCVRLDHPGDHGGALYSLSGQGEAVDHHVGQMHRADVSDVA